MVKKDTTVAHTPPANAMPQTWEEMARQLRESIPNYQHWFELVEAGKFKGKVVGEAMRDFYSSTNLVVSAGCSCGY